jgi:hypothetical protein
VRSAETHPHQSPPASRSHDPHQGQPSHQAHPTAGAGKQSQTPNPSTALAIPKTHTQKTTPTCSQTCKPRHQLTAKACKPKRHTATNRAPKSAAMQSAEGLHAKAESLHARACAGKLHSHRKCPCVKAATPKTRRAENASKQLRKAAASRSIALCTVPR